MDKGVSHRRGREETENLLQRERVLRTERQHHGVVAGGRLQLEVERLAKALPQRKTKRAVDPGAAGRMNDELHATGVVEEPLDHETARCRQRPELAVASRQIRDELLCHGPVDPGDSLDELDGSLRAGSGDSRTLARLELARLGVGSSKDGLDLSSQLRDRLRQLRGPGRRFPEPERDARRSPLCVDDPYGARLDPADPPRDAPEEEHVPRHRLDRPVLVDRADESLLRLEHDAEVGDIRDRPARCHRGQTGAPSGPQYPVYPVAMQVGAAATPTCDDTLADEVHHRLEILGTELGVGRGPADKG